MSCWESQKNVLGAIKKRARSQKCPAWSKKCSCWESQKNVLGAKNVFEAQKNMMEVTK
jgi:hypothetical protein